MHPVLFEIPIFGGPKIHSYGVMIAVGFLAALAWIRFQSRREGLPIKQMTDFAFWMILLAIIGSRIAYVVVEWRAYVHNPLAVFKVWEGGLVFFGGLLACLIGGYFFLKKYALSFWKVGDVFTTGAALGHAFGRLGCFFAGCCHGRACEAGVWYAVHFPEGVGSIAPTGIPLYPTQLMEAVGNFLLFLFLAIKSQKKAFDGQILLLYLIIYSIFRMILEVFRGDLERGFIIKDYLSTSQFIGIILVVFAISVFIYRRGRKL